MPSFRRSVAVLAAAFALATPAGALAQSAGDDQYQDPFGDSGDSGGSGGGGSATPTPTPPTPAGTAAPSTPAPAPTASSSQAPAAQPAGQLPYTGSPVQTGLVAGAGALLLVGGVGLRVRLREPT
jgi:hypothetical protein